MKILFIANYGDLYGANRSLLSVIKYFKENGSQVLVFVPSKGGMSTALAHLEVETCVIPFFSSFLYVKYKLKYLLWPLLLIFNSFSFIYILIIAWCFKPSLIYSNTLAENMGVFISKIIKSKHILHVREFMSLDHGGGFIFGERIKRHFLGLSDAVIFVSTSVKNYHLRFGKLKGISKVIHNGVSAPKHVMLHKEFRGRPFKLGIVGIIDPGKGHLKAFEFYSTLNETIQNVELHVFGDKPGNYKDLLGSFIIKNALENKIIFHGFVESIDEIYNSFDALLMFSVSEGFGRVTVEAMARGIPVIGYNNGGTSEIIDDYINGYLFDNYKEFKAAFDHLLVNYNKMSLAAYQKYYSNFTENIYVEKVSNFVNDVLKT